MSALGLPEGDCISTPTNRRCRHRMLPGTGSCFSAIPGGGFTPNGGSRRRYSTCGTGGKMTVYSWKHWFWITVFGVVLIECSPLSSIDTYPSKLKLEEQGGNKSTYLKRAGEPAIGLGGSLPGSVAGSRPSAPGGGPPFISSLPPMAAASSGLVAGGVPASAAPTLNSLLEPDVDDTFASGSLAGTDFGGVDSVLRYTRKDVEGGSSTSGPPVVGEVEVVEDVSSSSSTTSSSVAGQAVPTSGRFKKNGTIFTRNEQNITTLKLKNYNRGLEKEELKAPRVPERGTRLIDSLMLTAVDNSTDDPVGPDSELEEATELSIHVADPSSGENVTNPTVVETGDSLQMAPAPSDDISSSNSSFSDSSSGSNRVSINSSSSNSPSVVSNSRSDQDISDGSHSEGSSGIGTISSDRRIGKTMSADFRDFVSHTNTNPNFSTYNSRAIAFSTANLQEGVDDQDHPLEDDDYRRSSRSAQRLNVGAISGICLASLGLLSGISAALIILYRRYLYLNKPQTLSEPDSSGYIDDSTIRDNSDEMYSLDNDSFLNSLEAMTIQNYWTDNVKHTKL
ncbi:uncharacterized protein LOC129749763 [Uranotaenia lowii]|uniref:uncharacterized protein LOC129749763 n=1 Tax=Uranotaenia lowii TaxID=190385 RepID=UPI00247A80D0|nr:uncharacterized protein LOC129749763 [Uranotaenia lowii]XP_055600822.1 uncharacterized protein LOC129749763 [Uranotaenia lowii]